MRVAAAGVALSGLLAAGPVAGAGRVAAAVTVQPPYPVVSAGQTVVDTHRWTVSFGHVLAHSRTLRVQIYYPAGVTGRMPLVVFCHGFDSTPAVYSHLLEHWAAMGFFVAAPIFPLTNPGAGRWLDEADVDNQPRDVSVVITAVEKQWSQKIDPTRVAVAGHSDGAETSYAVGFATRVRDPRVSAILVFSGAARPSLFPFAEPASRLALLVVQSNADESNSPLAAWWVWSHARAPRLYLHLFGARHLPPFAYPCPWRPIVEAVTTDFLRWWDAFGRRPARVYHDALLRDARQYPSLSWPTDDL
jgi:hypothetical protein